ncbi:ABC transporter permease [Bosea sp. NBC_00550]|uniref:ABC transporter permease n=1 Tax=Bosea sp. NBC_00550 TaxID=2969621 RepID=UPI00222FF964|nr:ABC transporter permease [Bosea sp. NBC_00550]UZF95632.1 ABC transporter permease [Bosea sp. NBC_00550]
MAVDLTLPVAAQGGSWSASGWGRALIRPPFLLYAPATLFLAVFFLAPLGLVVWISVSEPTLGLDNYAEFFASKYDLSVLARTFQTALIVTVTSLIFAYPVAYVAARKGGAVAAFLLGVVALSFWTSFLVRTYAWMVILGARGPVVGVLVALGVTPPPRLLFTTFAATFAMAHMLVPFMVLALYAVMKRIDEVYMRAAASLGARPLRAFLTVYLPQSLPGVLNGATLVFITCLGFYVTPTLIGSPQDKMIAGRIGQQIEQLLEFGAASATSMVLLAAAVALFVIYDRLFGIEKMWR